MKTKEQLQDELIQMFEDWFKRGKPLGYDNGRTMINIYDSEVKKLNIHDVDNLFCDLYKEQCVGNLCSVTPNPEKCEHLKQNVC